MVFQGPNATIRWVGNEGGFAPYPAWNSLPAVAARSGVAVASHGRPDGDAWLPNECDVSIRANWFWDTKNAATLKSLDELVKLYYRSVGHGAVLLLNVTPDVTGLIPEADVNRCAEFGAEIRRRFGKSLAETSGTGPVVTLALEKPMWIDHVIAMEDITQGERIRQYVIEGLVGDTWRELCVGTAVGHKKIDQFDAVRVRQVRLRVIKAAAVPQIRKLTIYNVAGKL